MRERIAVILGLSFVLPLLFGGSCVYAEASVSGGNGEIVPSVTYIHTIWDDEKFAEDHWIRRGVTGGVGDYSYINENGHGDSIVAEGRGLAGNSDYLFNFDLKKEGIGNLIFEFKQFNKYYDGTGGYYSPFANLISWPNPLLETSRDLFLDIGELKVEATLSKEEGTECVFTYEREYRKGAKSLTSWGPVVGVVGNVSTTRNILPTFLQTDEIVDKLDLKIEHTVNGIDISAEQAWERVKIESQKVNNRTLTLSSGLFSNVRYKYENLDSDLYTTIIRVAKDFNEKIFLSAAFLYEYYRGHTIETVTDESTSSYNENNPNNPARVYQDTFTFLPKISIFLMEHLLADVGLRWAYIDKNGGAAYNRDRTNPPDQILDEFLNIDDNIMDNHLGETFNLKFDGIRDVAFYANVDLEQQSRNEINSQNAFGPSPTDSNNFYRDTITTSYDYDYTVGAKGYPMPKVDVTAEFRYKYGFRDYHNKAHNIQTGDIDLTKGYRGFLDSISYTSIRPLVMFNFKPYRWLACNFRYAYDSTIYGVKTRVADATEFSESGANIYSTGVTLMPNDTLYLMFYYQYKEAATKTPANGTGGGPLNVPAYNANVKALSVSCSYLPVKNITIRGSYTFYKNDNFNNFAGYVGLPFGLDNFSQDASIGIETKIYPDCSLEFKYDFAGYDETSNNGIDNYQAHLFYADLKMKF